MDAPEELVEAALDAIEDDLMSAMSSILGSDDEAVDLATDLLAAIQPYVWGDVTDAARLRTLAATFDATPDATFTGAQVAAKLRDGGADA